LESHRRIFGSCFGSAERLVFPADPVNDEAHDDEAHDEARGDEEFMAHLW
jgi:hypothetical protein